jgi:predicted DNA-binding transcriptional regulator AlpA
MRSDSGTAPQELEALLDVGDVAAVCKTSIKTVYRLVERGLLAAPIKLGKLNRWRREDVLHSIGRLAKGRAS